MAQAKTPSDTAIREKMKILVPQVDLQTITTKQFIRMLSEQMGGTDLASRKKYIKATLTEILDEMDNSDSSSEDESEVKEPPQKKKRGGGGLATVKAISDELAVFLGKGKEMARTEVVKGLWGYIKAHDLQNPDDRREIILDEKMKELFHCERFTMFSMNKYIGAHIHPFKPVNLTELSDNSKKKKIEAAEKRAKKRAKTKGDKKKGRVSERRQGTQAPWRLSDALKAVVGKDILPRPQVTQALWVYIKKHGLQNPEDKREIICDDVLRPIMGGQEKVTIFTMNKHISPHMLEKLDKSAYVHEVVVKNEGNSQSGEDIEQESADDDIENYKNDDYNAGNEKHKVSEEVAEDEGSETEEEYSE